MKYDFSLDRKLINHPFCSVRKLCCPAHSSVPFHASFLWVDLQEFKLFPIVEMFYFWNSIKKGLLQILNLLHIILLGWKLQFTAVVNMWLKKGFEEEFQKKSFPALENLPFQAPDWQKRLKLFSDILKKFKKYQSSVLTSSW